MLGVDDFILLLSCVVITLLSIHSESYSHATFQLHKLLTDLPDDMLDDSHDSSPEPDYSSCSNNNINNRKGYLTSHTSYTEDWIHRDWIVTHFFMPIHFLISWVLSQPPEWTQAELSPHPKQNSYEVGQICIVKLNGC